MKVQELMTRRVYTCHPNDSLRTAAQIMWEHDCGCVPVVDSAGTIEGIVTDRDGFIRAYMTGSPLEAIPVRTAMALKVLTCRADDDVATAERTLRDAQVHRLPVVDGARRVVGLLSLNDIARHIAPGREASGDGLSSDAIALTVTAIGRPRAHSGAL